MQANNILNTNAREGIIQSGEKMKGSTKTKAKTEGTTLNSRDICEATLPNEEQFTCVLKKKMRGWEFPAWEVRITRGPSLGCITHVREEALRLIEAFDPQTAAATGRYGSW